MSGLAVRRACYSVIRFVMDAGANGCEIVISGKLRGQRAQSMKFVEGYMVKSGHAVTQFVDIAIRHAKMRQGILGVKVMIMKKYDAKGKLGPSVPLADVVTILDPKEDRQNDRPYHKSDRKPQEYRRGRGGFRGRGSRGGYRGRNAEDQRAQPVEEQIEE